MRKTSIAWLALACACGGEAAMPDAGTDAAGGPDAALPTSCDGACRTTALTARFGATTRTFDRAVYGVTAPAGQAPTLHVEAYRGGPTGCPTASSPTPDYTLVLGELAVPTTPAAVATTANVLDFVGDLLGGPLGAAATAATATPVALDVCPACVGQPAPADPDGLIALDLAATFAAGTVSGHLFATHCDSLDAI
ncbi:MAG: hypothetical protein JNK64_19575 [Myxococcales bacterium]|nr:hypothetical protein [Myxococcales bacterium]